MFEWVVNLCKEKRNLFSQLKHQWKYDELYIQFRIPTLDEVSMIQPT